MNKKIFMVGVLLLAVCITISAVSADEGFNFSFSSSDSSNSDGDSIKFDNGKLVIQGIEFAIPEELGKMCTPPLGKSGVNHRLRRLVEIAETIEE